MYYLQPGIRLRRRSPHGHVTLLVLPLAVEHRAQGLRVAVVVGRGHIAQTGRVAPLVEDCLLVEGLGLLAPGAAVRAQARRGWGFIAESKVETV